MKIKTTFFIAIAWLAALTTASAFLGNEFSNVITKMIDRMRAIRLTGDPDSDFSNIMSEHNQGAVDLANAELKLGSDAAVKAIAKNILAKQQAEQGEMKKHIRKGKVVPVAAAAQQPSNQSPMEENVKDIVADIEKWMKKTPMTGNADKDFVAAMVEHYKDEMKIANMEIRHGKDQKVKDLATKAKSDSQSIEKELSDWLSNHSK